MRPPGIRLSRRGRAAAIPTLVIVLALLVRLPGLTLWPPSIHQDEASNGVDAWSLLTTGADRAGRVSPVFLQGFGEGDNRTSLYAWLAVPLVALFGPGPLSTRLPAALVGVWTVAVSTLLIRRLRGDGAAAWTGILLALNPWHVYLSRFGHEASLTPAFVITGLWAAGFSKKGWAAPVLAGIVLGAGLYTYPSYRIFLPLLLLGAWIVGWERSPRRWVALLCGLALSALPLALASLAHPDRLLARSAAASLFHQVRPLGAAFALFVEQYLRHFHPSFLVFRGDANPLHSPAGGQLLPIEPIIALIGAYLAVRRRDRWDRLFLLWLVLYPLASAASLGDEPQYVPHSLRAAVGLPLFQILGGSAAAELLRALSTRSRVGARIAGTAGFAIVAICFLSFAVRFTGNHARRTARLYHNADARAMEYAARRQEPFDVFLISATENHQAYIHAMLFGLLPPRSYQNLPKRITQTETFHLVREVGSFYFIHDRHDLEIARTRLRGRVLALAGPGELGSGSVIAEFPDPGGEGGRVLRYLIPAGP